MRIYRNALHSLLLLNDGICVTQFSKLAKLSIGYCFEVVQDYERMGLIKTHMEGRRRIINLTKKGKEVKYKMFNIKNTLDGNKINKEDSKY